MRDTEREAETQAEEEAGSMQEPNMGLDPGSPGSRPGLKADTKPLSHLGCPLFNDGDSDCRSTRLGPTWWFDGA